jgi:hypothetical protein
MQKMLPGNLCWSSLTIYPKFQLEDKLFRKVWGKCCGRISRQAIYAQEGDNLR